MKRCLPWLLVLLAGCGSATTTRSASESTPVVFNAVGAPVVEFEAPAMHCESCAATVVAALREKPGVVDVKADSGTGIVSVAVEEAAFTPDTAIAAIADAGFGEATLVEEAAPTESEEPAADNAG